MTRETIADLNTQTLIGYTDKRGTAWHYRETLQGSEPNHYPSAIPVDDVVRRLFHWSPIAAPVRAEITGTDGQPLSVVDPSRIAIVRPDTATVLGVHSAAYKVHDYREWLLDNVASILDADLQIGSAGLLRGGAWAWVQVELEDTVSVEGVDFRPFLTAATSLDGKLATTYQTGAQVVVCDNTLSAALNERGARRLTVRHSSRSLGRLGDVREALSIVYAARDDFADTVRELTTRKVTEAEWDAFVEAFTAPSPTAGAAGKTLAAVKADQLHQLWSSDERAAQWRGTAYGVVAAVNTYRHHIAAVRGASRAARNAERMVSGDFNTLDAETLRLLDTVTA